MSNRRRIGIALGAVVALVGAGAAALWLFWVPAQVRARVAEAAARRGLTAEVAGVSAGFSDVELRGLVVRGGGDALSVRVESVHTGAGVLALATEGTAAIRRLELDGVRVTAALDDPRLRGALEALQGETQEPSAAPSEGRHVHAAGLEALLRDEDGSLLEVGGGEATLLPEGVLRVHLGSVAIGRGDPDGADLEAASLRAERGEAGWQVSQARAEHARVRYRERDSDERSPLWARLRRHARLLEASESDPEPADGGGGEDPDADRSGGATERGPDEGAEDDGDADEGAVGDPDEGDPDERGADESGQDEGSRDEGGEGGAPEGGEGEGGPSDGTREDGAGGIGQGGAGESGAGEGSAARALLSLLERVAPRIAPGALLHLEDLAVVATGEDGERGVLSDLTADVRSLEGARYLLEGEGRPGRGGRLSWDLTVEPRTLHAEGNVELSRLPFVLLVPLLPRLPWHEPEDARVSGQLRIDGSGVGRAHVSGNATLDDLALASDRIAPGPVRRIRLRFDGEADWIGRERRLEVSRARLGVGDAAVDVTGTLEWPEDHYLLDATVTLPPTDCNTAVGAIPSDLLGELTAFTFTGRLGGQVRVHVDSRDLDATQLSIRVANGCQFETAPQLADVRRFEGAFQHRVVEPDGTVFEMETGPGTAAWTPISRISPFFVHAVLGHEDAGFFRHGGFSPASIRLALVRNLRNRRYVYGASTITMQLVKNVFLHREKTLARKVQEVLLTWWLESVMEKERILELYLNVIEYGPGVYGIRNAAMHYFGCAPSELGPAQSAYLATILPNPKAFHSHYEEDALPARHRRRVERFLRTLESRGRYDAEAVAHAMAQLEGFEFHQPGEPVRLAEPIVGHVRPLPINGVWGIADPWEEELEDPDPGEPEGTDDGWDTP